MKRLRDAVVDNNKKKKKKMKKQRINHRPELVSDVVRLIIVDYLAPLLLEKMSNHGYGSDPKYLRKDMRRYAKVLFRSCSWLVPTSEQRAVHQGRLLSMGLTVAIGYLLLDPYPDIVLSGADQYHYQNWRNRDLAAPLKTADMIPSVYYLNWQASGRAMHYFLPHVHRFVLTSRWQPLNLTETYGDFYRIIRHDPRASTMECPIVKPAFLFLDYSFFGDHEEQLLMDFVQTFHCPAQLRFVIPWYTDQARPRSPDSQESCGWDGYHEGDSLSDFQ